MLRESPAAPRTLHRLKRTTTAPRPQGRPASHDPRGGRVGGSVSVTPASAMCGDTCQRKCAASTDCQYSRRVHVGVCGFCAHVILVTMFLRHVNLLLL